MSAALGRVGWRGREIQQLKGWGGVWAGGRRRRGSETSKAKSKGCIRGEERERWTERRRRESEVWIRIVSKEGDAAGWGGGWGRGAGLASGVSLWFVSFIMRLHVRTQGLTPRSVSLHRSCCVLTWMFLSFPWHSWSGRLRFELITSHSVKLEWSLWEIRAKFTA